MINGFQYRVSPMEKKSQKMDWRWHCVQFWLFAGNQNIQGGNRRMKHVCKASKRDSKKMPLFWIMEVTTSKSGEVTSSAPVTEYACPLTSF